MNFKKNKLLSAVITTAALSFGAVNVAAAADKPTCEIDRTINFGGMSWESNLVISDVQRFILENGYGCKLTFFLRKLYLP